MWSTSQMKKIATIAVLALVIVGSIASAAFKLPKNVHKIENLADAQTEAREKNKPIAILLTDPNTTCPLMTRASVNVIDALSNKAVVVYLPAAPASNEEWAKEWALLPKLVQDALKSPEAGKTAPITIVVDADAKTLIAVIPYVADKDRRARLAQAKEQIAEWQKSQQQPSATGSPTKAETTQPSSDKATDGKQGTEDGKKKAAK
jgi:hypothetical protein